MEIVWNKMNWGTVEISHIIYSCIIRQAIKIDHTICYKLATGGTGMNKSQLAKSQTDGQDELYNCCAV